jgi:hypothetical protein
MVSADSPRVRPHYARPCLLVPVSLPAAPEESSAEESVHRAGRPRRGKRRSTTRQSALRGRFGRLSRRGRILLAGGGFLFLVVVIMLLLALPLLSARHHAKTAQAELTQAKAALTAKDFKTARENIKGARSDVRQARDDANGFGAGVWSGVPVLGGAVDDARHLIDALAQATKIAEIGVKIYPQVSGTKGKALVQGTTLNLKLLDRVAKQTDQIGPHLNAAIKDLDQVQGSTPVVGGSIARARDSALADITPVRDSYLQTRPLIKELPTILGAHGPRSYLLAMLNPAELRYSGGAALSWTAINFIDGNISFGGSIDVPDMLAHGTYVGWPKVPGNIFHLAKYQRVTSSTFSPYWQASGEELLRAFRTAYPQHFDGVLVVDLQAIANILQITGPIDVPGFPQVTSANLVHQLAGNYGSFKDIQAHHTLNKLLIPPFEAKFFGVGDLLSKVRSLTASGQQRHLALYFRDPKVEAEFAKAGLTGNLSSSPNDYLGAFTQNTNGSKTDYWQKRDVSSRVQLHQNGSATVHLAVSIDNASPAYTGPAPDPKSGYLTRWLGTALGVFLPTGAQVQSATLDGQAFVPKIRTPQVAGVYNRPFFARSMLIPRGATRVLDVTYRVPHAAVKSTGGMTYRLDVDPQGMVIPATLHVQVTWPDGYTAQSVPAGWSSASATSATYAGPLDTIQSYEIPLTAN